MQEKLAAVDRFIGAQMLDPRTEQVARPPNDPVNRRTFGEEQLRQVRAVLPGDAGNEGALSFRHGG